MHPPDCTPNCTPDEPAIDASNYVNHAEVLINHGTGLFANEYVIYERLFIYYFVGT